MNSSNKLIFIAELIGTFGLVVGATGSIVYDGMLGGIYGNWFQLQQGHFVALADCSLCVWQIFNGSL